MDRTRFQKATDHARKMLCAQDAMPIMDAMELSKDVQVEEIFSIPLFPVVSLEERAQFFEHLKLLSNWNQELRCF